MSHIGRCRDEPALLHQRAVVAEAERALLGRIAHVAAQAAASEFGEPLRPGTDRKRHCESVRRRQRSLHRAELHVGTVDGGGGDRDGA